MNDFLQALIGLRNKAGNVARGTFDSVRNANERGQQRIDAERARNTEMIRENFGTEQNYLDLQDDVDLPKTTGEKLGDFVQRLMQLRRGDRG